jgi:hypothetical protein
MTTLARARSNCKRQTRPLVRESAPHQQNRNCLTVIKIWSLAPDGCFIPRQTGRLTVGRNIRLRNLRKFLMNLIKSETPVCPDELINFVFQVLSDEGRPPGLLLMVNVFVLPSSNMRYHFLTLNHSLHLPHTLQ